MCEMHKALDIFSSLNKYPWKRKVNRRGGYAVFIAGNGRIRV